MSKQQKIIPNKDLEQLFVMLDNVHKLKNQLQEKEQTEQPSYTDSCMNICKFAGGVFATKLPLIMPRAENLVVNILSEISTVISVGSILILKCPDFCEFWFNNNEQAEIKMIGNDVSKLIEPNSEL